jgi:hypothetical protein
MIRELMDIFVQKNTYTTLIRHPSGEVTIQDEKEGEEKLTLLPARPLRSHSLPFSPILLAPALLLSFTALWLSFVSRLHLPTP